MNKQEIKDFFNRLAPSWDAGMIKDDRIIEKILTNAGVAEDKDILDVACGTGVLFPYYFAKKVRSLTAVDISPEMVRIAVEKFKDNTSCPIRIICDDIMEMNFDRKFDCIMIYNAFPHFDDPKGLINILSRQLKPGGTLTVAHGMSRSKIDSHHHGAASSVSIGLMSEDELASLMEPKLSVICKISDDEMYQVSAIL